MFHLSTVSTSSAPSPMNHMLCLSLSLVVEMVNADGPRPHLTVCCLLRNNQVISCNCYSIVVVHFSSGCVPLGMRKYRLSVEIRSTIPDPDTLYFQPYHCAFRNTSEAIKYCGMSESLKEMIKGREDKSLHLVYVV